MTIARSQTGRTSRYTASVMLLSVWLSISNTHVTLGAEQLTDAEISYDETIQPILEQYCYGCHGYGSAEGGMVLDQFASSDEAAKAPTEWWRVLRQLRAGLMPPLEEERPSADEIASIEAWIKASVFQVDPQNPDPGRVTVRRLNRVEYRNTVRDLLGVDYDTQKNFPADDTGEGFDNIADVLTISPLLLEKYLEAARTVVAEAVPTTSGVVPEQVIPGSRFREDKRRDDEGALSLSYYEDAAATMTVTAETDGQYIVKLDLRAVESYVDNQFDYNKCRFTFKIDGKTRLDQEFVRQGGQPFHFAFDQEWSAGDHELTIELTPLTPDVEQVRSLRVLINDVTIAGPLGDEYLVPPPNYRRFFPRDVPADIAGRREYARELLGEFAMRAFRRPVDEETVGRLVALAERISSAESTTFEKGIAQAMTAVLASPRFLFREEGVEPAPRGAYPLIDEYALASRLSYFLWSSMPDDELLRLAGEHKLRDNLHEQVTRMLNDPRCEELIRNFTGQWLLARDIESVQINAFAVMAREREPDPEADRRRERFRELARKPAEELSEEEKQELDEVRRAFFESFRNRMRFDLDSSLRLAMRRETEMLFEHIVRNDRSLLELIDSDYTFLNDRLARHYGIDAVEGGDMRLVSLPAESQRGGVLTQGTVLAVTSNPDRTSPVKRGVFVLENILGIPPAAPPPDIPPLEDSEKEEGGKKPSLREALALHRSNSLCSSCHDRMDPLGLAFENFNALGRWREREQSQEIEVAGTLISGESFSDARELKRVLATQHSREFYRCLTEKLMTYALGRGLDYNDVHTVDEIVQRIDANDGRASELLLGIIESAPFQRTRARSE